MTIDDFLTELSAAVRDKDLIFYKSSQGYIQVKNAEAWMCPVCALCYLKLNTNYWLDFLSAGLDLGLSETDSSRLANAADHPDSSYRKVLEKACGLLNEEVVA